MPKEDFLSVIRSEKKDPSMLYLFDVTLGMELAGYDTDEVFRNGIDGEKSARSLIATAKHFKLDACNGSVMWFDNRVLGNKTVFPPKGIPYTSEFVLSDPSKLSKLDNSSIPKEHLEQIAKSHSMVAESTDCALVYHTPSPLGAASSLRGLQNILMDMMLEPDYTRSLLIFSGETTKIVHKRVTEDTDIDMALISGAYDNIDLIGPEYLQEFSTAPLKRTLKFLSGSCKTTCFHPHGTLSADCAKNALKEYQTSGIDCLYYGEFNDPIAIHEFVPKMSLIGGIDTFTTIILGDEKRVKKDTADRIEQMKDVPHIFSCSCSVDRGLPVNKLNVMCQTVKSFTFS